VVVRNVVDSDGRLVGSFSRSKSLALLGTEPCGLDLRCRLSADWAWDLALLQCRNVSLLLYHERLMLFRSRFPLAFIAKAR
jgi:hypothetical protein